MANTKKEKVTKAKANKKPTSTKKKAAKTKPKAKAAKAKPKTPKATPAPKPKANAKATPAAKAAAPEPKFVVYCLTEHLDIATDLELDDAIAATAAHTPGHQVHYLVGKPPALPAAGFEAIATVAAVERYDVFCPECRKRLLVDLEFPDAFNKATVHNDSNDPVHHAYPDQVAYPDQ